MSKWIEEDLDGFSLIVKYSYCEYKKKAYLKKCDGWTRRLAEDALEKLV